MRLITCIVALIAIVVTIHVFPVIFSKDCVYVTGSKVCTKGINFVISEEIDNERYYLGFQSPSGEGSVDHVAYISNPIDIYRKAYLMVDGRAIFTDANIKKLTTKGYQKVLCSNYINDFKKAKVCFEKDNSVLVIFDGFFVESRSFPLDSIAIDWD
jgi:hypothetical protein